MRWRLTIATILALVLMTGPALAATHSIPVKGDKSELQSRRGDRGRLALPCRGRHDRGPGRRRRARATSRACSFPGFHNSQVDGSPELPMMNRLISIPVGAEARVEVVSQQTRTIRLADFGITNALMPHQPSLAKNADPATVPFLYNRDAYGQDKVEQPLARVVYEGRLRAMDIGRLEISPVRYLPGSGEIEVVESLELSVTFPGADEAAAEQLRASTWSPFFQNMYAMMDGNRGFHDNYPDHVRDVVTYGHRHAARVPGPAAAVHPVEDRARLPRHHRRHRLAGSGHHHHQHPDLHPQPVQQRHARAAGAELRALRRRRRPVPDLAGQRRRHRPSVLRHRRRLRAGHLLRPLLGDQRLAAAGAARQDHDVRPVHHARPQLPQQGRDDRRRGRQLRRSSTATARSTTAPAPTSTPPTASRATPTCTRSRAATTP